MEVNKVIYGNTTLIDISDTTAESSDVAQGKYFYSANGEKTQGSAIQGVLDVDIDGVSVVDANKIAQIPAIPSKISDLNNDSGYITGMTILSYGHSTWADFQDAYTNNKVVYCRASSQSNPGTGSQTRLAFMAYVNNAETPTEVEFQYYRSIATHTNTQQGDQVYVYKLNKSSGWSVTVREAYTTVLAGTGGITSTYNSSGSISINAGSKIEKTSNKTTTLSSSSTTTQYPSAKTVYDALQELSNRITVLEEQMTQ